MRLFIAIDLPRSFKAEVTRIQKELKQLSCGGRFVPANNFHITLHFIGESRDLQGAVAAMHEAAQPVLYARETSRSVTKRQLLSLCDTLLSLSQTDRAFTYWLQSIAGLSEHPEQVNASIHANLAGMRDWLSARMDSSMSICSIARSSIPS